MGPNFQGVLSLLSQCQVRFIVIGGGAARQPMTSMSFTLVMNRILKTWQSVCSHINRFCEGHPQDCRFAGTIRRSEPA